MPFSRGSSQARDQTSVSYISCIFRWTLYCWATWEADMYFTTVIKKKIILKYRLGNERKDNGVRGKGRGWSGKASLSWHLNKANIWEKGIPGRGNSLCKGPVVGMSMICSQNKWKTTTVIKRHRREQQVSNPAWGYVLSFLVAAITKYHTRRLKTIEK